jgi:hypothetical protein
MKLWVQHEVNIVQFFVVSAAAYTDNTIHTLFKPFQCVGLVF